MCPCRSSIACVPVLKEHERFNMDGEKRRPVASRFRNDEGYDIEGVTLTDVDIPFERMVAIMVKWSFAAIPAAIILFLVFLAVGALLGIAGIALGFGS